MNTTAVVLVLIFQNMSDYSWLITWMKIANNFQVSKVQPQCAT